MSRFYAQMMVLAAFGVAFCQGITASVPVENNDSTIVNAVSAAGDSTKSGIEAKVTAIDAKTDSLSTAPKEDSSELTTDSTSVQDSSDIFRVSGDTVKTEDGIKIVKVSEKPSTTECKITGGRNGIGVNMMVKFIMSSELNNYLDDLYKKMIDDADGIVMDETGFSGMPVMIGFKVKGIVYVIPELGLEPFGTFNYGWKMMKLKISDKNLAITLIDKDVRANLFEYGGGLNIWARVSSARVASFKAGLGGYVTYTYLNVESYDGTVDHSGFGGGMNLLAGVDITLKKITINVDFSIPIGSSELTQDGSFTNRGNNQIRYPDGYRHTGIEIRPGVMFHF